ncbi:MAG: hypothetical protein CBC48_21130 [bacterium TMED88]|nr:MAG: hypothetical protein CBC48_21130 [bacterium TMED88]
MTKPFRIDSYDVHISNEEKREIENIWPFENKRESLKENDLSLLLVDILDYFGLSSKQGHSKPNTLAELSRDLRSTYWIESIPLKGNSLKLNGDNGLILAVYNDGIRLIKPRWYGGYPNIDQNYEFAVLLIRCLTDQGTTIVDLMSNVFHKQWKLIVVIIIVAMVAVLIGLIPTWLQEYIFDTVVPDGSRFLMIQIGIFLLCLKLTGKSFNLFNSLIGVRIELSFGYRLSAILIQKLLFLQPQFYSEHGVGDLLQRVNSAHAFRRAVQNSFVAVITAVIVVICNLGLVYFKTHSLELCLICIGLTLIVPIVDTISSIIESMLRLRRLEVAALVEDSILKPMESLASVRSLSIEDFYFKFYAINRKKLARIDISIGILRSLTSVISLIIGSTIIGLLLYWFGKPSSLTGLGVSGSQTVDASQGFIILLLSAFSTANGAVQSFSKSVLMLVKTIPDAIRFHPIITAESAPLARIKSWKSHVKRVEFNNLGYVDKANAMKTVFKIPKLIVNQSDTVLLFSKQQNICSNMYDHLCGLIYQYSDPISNQTIMINDKDLYDKSSSDHYRQHFIALTRSSPWISGTLHEALTGQSANIDDAWLQSCLSAVKLKFSSDDLSCRYDMNTTDQIQLSMEQKFKISIARALYLRYDFIIIDRIFDSMPPSILLSVIDHIKTYKQSMIVLTCSPELTNGHQGVYTDE